MNANFRFTIFEVRDLTFKNRKSKFFNLKSIGYIISYNKLLNNYTGIDIILKS